ncbi:LacI family DNA-binding transcriptional regulator [Saccharothrix sp. HUAS TT1]|uniref:LacI family DNA-binding transcriptional regulator n=1 Tax=unclassified Saccharothrix TaxID=2593673 RepID=UPI00345C2443
MIDSVDKPDGRAAEPRRPTMRSIAHQAGVNVSTVSRALRAAPGQEAVGVGADVVARIHRIADELGYRPDPHAASLRSRRTNVVGVLVPRLSDVVLATIFEGVDAHCTEHGYQAVVANTGDDPAEHARRLDLMRTRRVDGLILADTRLTDPPVDPGLPFVLVNRRRPGQLSVTCDDEAGGELVGDHFADLGHRHVGIVGGHPWAGTAVDRAHGCRAALARRGVEVPDSHLLHTGFDTRGGREATERLLRATPRPTAIFAVNDYAAVGVMGALRDAGLTPGRDVAVAGYNDIDVASELLIPLTTVDSSPLDMGRHAARTLLALLRGEDVSPVLLPPRLRIRSSTSDSAAGRGR